MNKIRRPFEGNYPITQRYGDSITEAFHPGIDYALPVGVPVLAVADGVVVDTKAQINGYGNYIQIQHNGNAKSLYAHLFKWIVKEGQHVTAGMVIGYSGNSGNSTGPHLHFEYWVDGKHVDPGLYFEKAGAVENPAPNPIEDIGDVDLGRVEIIANGVAIRSYPGFSSPILCRATKGFVLLSTNTIKYADGLRWRLCYYPVYVAENDGTTDLIEEIE
jgi:hypothetical protein